MKKIVLFTALIYCILTSASFANFNLKGGYRVEGLTLGLEYQPVSYRDWLWGCGAELCTGGHPIILSGSITHMLTSKGRGLPVYLAFGPVVMIGNDDVPWGGFIHLGMIGMFRNVPEMYLEGGLDLLSDGLGATIELGYRFY